MHPVKVGAETYKITLTFKKTIHNHLLFLICGIEDCKLENCFIRLKIHFS